MAAKFDKELLKKHHFWFLFIPVVIFLLVAWYALEFDVSDAINAKQKKNEDAKKDYADIAPLPRKTIEEYGKHLGQVDEQRHKMWKDGWAEQKDLYVWPKGYTPQQRAVFDPFSFGQEIPERTEQVRDQFRDPKVYPNEFKKLIDAVQPMRFRDNWEKVLQYITVWGRVPSSEDMWLAMEDLWVQRELLMAIHQVNADAARFTMEKTPPGSPLKRRFKSRFWEVELELADLRGKQVLKGSLTNISNPKRLLVLGVGNTMKLKVMLGDKSFDFEVQGDSVEADAKMPIKLIESKHTIPDEWKAQSIDGVEQVFDVRTVPIKRIEHMNRGPGALSDRNKDLTIKMANFSELVAKKEPTPTAGEGDAATTGKNFPLAPLSQNGLLRYRYIDATETIRRLPVAVVLTTDQSFMKDIVESLMNTKLRFQLTQLDWIRFHDSLNYNATGSVDPMRKNDTLPGGTGPTNSRDDQFSANLMEISIYGIISLYERYPDEKPKK